MPPRFCLACGTVHAVMYKADAIRPYKWRKTNIAKTIFDAGKTMSYVEKIISDIIQTTSDLFPPTCNVRKNKPLQRLFPVTFFF